MRGNRNRPLSWVIYKDDPYGPHGLIRFGVAPHKKVADGVIVPVKTAPLPEEKLPACYVFGKEWKQRAFTKWELAESIEGILGELNIRF